MHPSERLAVLLDGEFVRKVLQSRLERFPSADDVAKQVDGLLATPPCTAFRLLRVFYYTADPLAGSIRHPLTREQVALGGSALFRQSQRLISQLEMLPRLAVRRGSLVQRGWQIGAMALEQLTRGVKSQVEARDLVPRIEQKGVDMRIGLDLASLALKRLVTAVVIVTGDSDLVPAMKLARREGLEVYLATLGSASIRPELRVHADIVL